MTPRKEYQKVKKVETARLVGYKSTWQAHKAGVHTATCYYCKRPS